jgi:uncharacterized membrane protein YgdD (TMEM256/DUF423 family)
MELLLDRTFVLFGAGLAFLAVALGAFGAHGLAAHFQANPDLEATYHTAVQYHMFHALALLALAWATAHWQSPLFAWAGVAFIAGIVLFSGSLYLLSITGARWLGAVAPLGGLALLAGWALLFIGVWRA